MDKLHKGELANPVLTKDQAAALRQRLFSGVQITPEELLVICGTCGGDMRIEEEEETILEDGRVIYHHAPGVCRTAPGL